LNPDEYLNNDLKAAVSFDLATEYRLAREVIVFLSTPQGVW
jgi:hypothetical protein